MINETYKLLAVPYKIKRADNIDYRKKAYTNALEIYYRRDLTTELVDKIIENNNITIEEYDKDKEIREISHNLVSNVITSCLKKFDGL